MSATATPYGLRPVGTLTGPYNAQFRKFKIASGYATSIFTGDVVLPVSDGSVAKDTGTATATPLGIFVGCEFTNPTTGQKLQAPYWPASTVASDAVAFVVDNPYIVFQAQSAGSLAQTTLHNNVALVQNAGSTAFGLSRVTVGATPAVTATLPVRIIGFVDGPTSAVGDAFTDVLCIWNFGMHVYNTALGV